MQKRRHSYKKSCELYALSYVLNDKESRTPDSNRQKSEAIGNANVIAQDLHPSWKALIEYCRKLQHGDIERLRIQDGVPVIAEVITKKIKFSP